jgi:hypothetical protein
MSFGFVRRQSPAAKSAARRIKNLTIDEVSSVDHGAGHGVQVLLMKRDGQRTLTKRWDGRGQLGDRGFIYESERNEPTMDAISKGLSGIEPIAIAKRAHEALSNGEISEHRFGSIQKQLACAMFPAEPTEAHALAKFFDTVVGKSMLASRPRLSAARNYELMKAEARPGEEHPAAEHIDDDDDVDDDPLNGENPYHAAITAMASDLGEQKEHRHKSPAELYDHIARFNPAGKKLMAAATQWDLKRAAKVT